jgi:hypothetical protein
VSPIVSPHHESFLTAAVTLCLLWGLQPASSVDRTSKAVSWLAGFAR